MSIEIKITADNADDARVQLMGLLGGVSLDTVLAAAPAAPKTEVVKAAPKVTAKKDEPKADPTPAPAAPAETLAATADQPTEAASSGSATTAEEPAPLTYNDDVMPILLDVAAKFGRACVMDLLTDFGGVANAKDVSIEEWPRLIEAAKAKLA